MTPEQERAALELAAETYNPADHPTFAEVELLLRPRLLEILRTAMVPKWEYQHA